MAILILIIGFLILYGLGKIGERINKTEEDAKLRYKLNKFKESK